MTSVTSNSSTTTATTAAAEEVDAANSESELNPGSLSQVKTTEKNDRQPHS